MEICQSWEKPLREILPCRSLQKREIVLFDICISKRFFDKILHQSQIAKGEKKEFWLGKKKKIARVKMKRLKKGDDLKEFVTSLQNKGLAWE